MINTKKIKVKDAIRLSHNFSEKNYTKKAFISFFVNSKN